MIRNSAVPKGFSQFQGLLPKKGCSCWAKLSCCSPWESWPAEPVGACCWGPEWKLIIICGYWEQSWPIFEIVAHSQQPKPKSAHKVSHEKPLINPKKLFYKKVCKSSETELCQRVFFNSKDYCPKKAVVVGPNWAAAAHGGAALYSL